MSAPQTRTRQAPAPERRHNHSLRHQAQAWFQALQLHIGEVEGAEAIAALIQEWKRPEDVMRAYPALVPLFLDLAWRSRKTPGFAGLFQTQGGEVAEKSTDILALSQKSFDEIVVAHLMGTLRLMCERRQNEWLANERERRRGALSKIPVLGAVLRGLGVISPVKPEVLLASYPQKSLYDSLKPYLCRRDQFALAEAMSALPTRTVSLLGPVVGMLDSSAAIRTLADLDKSTVKTVIEMAEAYVQAMNDVQGESAASADLTAPRGAALLGILCAGMPFITLITDHRQLTKDAISKLAPAMGADIWAVFRDLESLRCIAECPAAVAEALKALTAGINQRVSIALAEIADGRIATFAVETLRDGVDSETFLSWIREETYVTAWKQLAHHLNKVPSVPVAGERLGPNLKAAIRKACGRGSQVFADIKDPPKKAA